jgi:hypothetical protein
MSQRKISAKRKLTSAKGVGKAKRAAFGPGASRTGTKQEAVLALLAQSKGATISAIMNGDGLATAFSPRLFCRSRA